MWTICARRSFLEHSVGCHTANDNNLAELLPEIEYRPIIDVHVYDHKIPLIVVRGTNKALVIVTNDLLE